MNPTFACRCVLAVLVVLSANVMAQSPKQIQWQDLAPKVASFDDPFEKLSRDQLLTLSDVAATRERKSKGDKAISAEDLAREQAGTKRLQQEDIPVSRLFKR